MVVVVVGTSLALAVVNAWYYLSNWVQQLG